MLKVLYFFQKVYGVNKMAKVAISQKGQLVIPKKFREKYKIKPKTYLELIDTGNGIALIPTSDDPISFSKGMLKETNVSTKTLLESKRLDKELEEKKVKRQKSG